MKHLIKSGILKGLKSILPIKSALLVSLALSCWAKGL